MDRMQLGQFGEDLAAQYLRGLGWRILARNWRCKLGELDIVAEDGSDTVVFCEVKTRRRIREQIPVPPLEAITGKKLQKLRQLAMAWLGFSG
ncbi:MAG: YraN family protein, partial [Propionibacteriaceae bacterium]|nr:YraN family protein [Propionibacteriaceae bacterium]